MIHPVPLIEEQMSVYMNGIRTCHKDPIRIGLFYREIYAGERFL